MFKRKDLNPFDQKVWLASPTMHNGAEMKYVTEAYETNWMSTVGKNINEVEKLPRKRLELIMQYLCLVVQLHCSFV